MIPTANSHSAGPTVSPHCQRSHGVGGSGGSVTQCECMDTVHAHAHSGGSAAVCLQVVMETLESSMPMGAAGRSWARLGRNKADRVVRRPPRLLKVCRTGQAAPAPPVRPATAAELPWSFVESRQTIKLEMQS